MKFIDVLPAILAKKDVRRKLYKDFQLNGLIMDFNNLNSDDWFIVKEKVTKYFVIYFSSIDNVFKVSKYKYKSKENFEDHSGLDFSSFIIESAEEMEE